MGSIAKNKHPAFHREPIIPDLVIQDLKDMERSGSYDRNVLLWLQDGYVNKAISQNIPHLRELHTNLTEAGENPDEIRRQKNQALVDLTRATYSTAKAAGDGADLKGYVDAAKTFFEAESARYGSHLQEVAEYIKKALENGEQPDIERYARSTYMSLAKLSGAMTQLEGLSGKPAAQQVATLMKKGIEQINFVAITDQPTNVGRELLKVVDKIGQNPGKYIEFRDPSRMAMPERGPWDFEPIQKQSSSSLSY